MTKRIALLGSTGSIGTNALKVISHLKERFKVAALSTNSNTKLLAEQSRLFRPDIVAVADPSLVAKARKILPSGTEIVTGIDGLNAIVSRRDIDMVVFAVSGSACLLPLISAIDNRKEIALANKESLVSAGPIIMKLAAERAVEVVPIDSEHSAVYQCIEGRRNYLSRIYLTGSGGPLLNVPRRDFDRMPRDFILTHPKWRMGKKISVDSATMMNKGLEIIEARWLFGLDEAKIEVLIHPEAIIHSMTEFIDGTVIAQMAVPDMRLPIQYALTRPERLRAMTKRIDFSSLEELSLRKPDTTKFPCLELARVSLRKGGTCPAVLNAADEEAVRSYLEGRIKFSAIPGITEKVLSRHKPAAEKTLSIADILDAEKWAREEARSLCCH